MQQSLDQDGRSERIANAVYGLILLVAGLGELEKLTDDVGTVIVVLFAAAGVLVLAHVYSRAVGLGVATKHLPHRDELKALAAAEISLAVPPAAAALVFLAAGADLLTVHEAFRVSILGCLAALFVLGTRLVASGRWLTGVLLGLANVGLGSTIVLLEHAL